MSAGAGARRIRRVRVAVCAKVFFEAACCRKRGFLGRCSVDASRSSRVRMAADDDSWAEANAIHLIGLHARVNFRFWPIELTNLAAGVQAQFMPP